MGFDVQKAVLEILVERPLATATPATSATPEVKRAGHVAEVAGVAVAASSNEDGNSLGTNPQKYQKSDLANFDTFEAASFAGSQKNCDTRKIMGTAPDGTDKTDNAPQMVVSSVLSGPTGSENEKFSGDQRRALEGEKEPLFFRHPTQESEWRRVIPFPGREWKPDTKIRPDDPER